MQRVMLMMWAAISREARDGGSNTYGFVIDRAVE